MRIGHKFLAASLLATVLLTPMLVLALCATAPASGSCCQQGCPMAKAMARMRLGHDGSRVTAKNSGSCCTIQNSTPAPVTESQVVAPVAIAMARAASDSASVARVADRAAVNDTSPPPPGQSQARLCTFRV
jgi:hypothetical protein